jgi:hypothetical protein
MTVAAKASGCEIAQLDAAPVFVLSHCREHPDHPDPEAHTLRALGEALAGTWGLDGTMANTPRPESGLPLYRAWGLADVGVFVDWCSLYQDKPKGTRTAEQTACFKKALDNMSLWYAHKLTTVLLVHGQDAHLWTTHEPDANGVFQPIDPPRPAPRNDSGWPYYEQARVRPRRARPSPRDPLPSRGRR